MFNGTRLRVQKPGAPSEWSPIHSLPVIALVGMCVGGCGSVDSGKSPPPTLASNVNPNQPDRNDAISPSATSPQTSVSFTFAPVFCCDPRSMVFEAQVPDSADSEGVVFRWEFGDGRTGGGSRIEHTYSWPGDYVVVLQADFRDGTVLSTDERVSLPATSVPPPDTPSPASQVDEPPPVEEPIVAETEVLADAGVDREVEAGAWVILDGSASRGTGTGALTFVWRQVEGPAVALVNPLRSTTTFFAPANLPAPATLVFELSVAQGTVFGIDQVHVIVPCPLCPGETNAADPPSSFRNDDAIAQVLAGQLSTANAAWWGFDANDATNAIQSAITSGAQTVLIPYVGQEWTVRPLFLVSNQEILFEPGVVLMAKEGAFRGVRDCLLSGDEVTNVTLRGYQAVLRMRKADYTSSGYSTSELRHVLSLRGVDNVQVLGLSLQSSGGDGIYLGPTEDDRRIACHNVVIRDCECHDNYRQGISVISAEKLSIVNSTVSGTIGTAPQAGIDLEPSHPRDLMVDIEVKDCTAIGNAGSGFMANLERLEVSSRPVSIHIVGCRVENSRQPGLRALLSTEGAPGGFIEFQNCTCHNIEYSGVACKWNMGSAIELRFVDCEWRDVARLASEAPVYLELSGRSVNGAPGGIQFLDCYVYDDQKRETVRVAGEAVDAGDADVEGDIYVINETIDEAVPQLGWPLPGLSVQMQEAK